jgi:peptidoglycan/LPS O-acetylase OafA/YrhL
MGLIRILLALAVVIAHSAPIFGFAPITPEAAVEAFYIISGFYMSIILTSKYEPNRRGLLLFYQNRYLRLMPTYLVVFALTTLAALAVGRTSYLHVSEILRIGSRMTWSTRIYLSAINLFVLGQDTAMFTAVDEVSGALRLCTDYTQVSLPAYKFLLVPQAWTIGVEFAFYAVAPWLVRAKARTVAVLVLAALVGRSFFYAHGLNHDPWTYRFFPFELALFLAGNLAYRAYVRFRAVFRDARLQKVALGWTVASVLLFQVVTLRDTIKYPLFFILFALALPALFDLTKNNNVDRNIGELSYPIYMAHLLVLRFCGWAGNLRGLAASVASIAFAALLVVIVERPVDRFRQQRARPERVATPATSALPAIPSVD